jgi:MFS family permease
VGRGRITSAVFWRVWTASTVSNLGDGLVLAALPLLAASVSDDPAGVAGMTAAATLPWLLFGLVAGVVVDRVERVRLMRVTDVARAAIVGVVALTVAADQASLPVLYLAVFALGTAETLFDSAAMAVLPAVVSAEELEEANGRLFGAQLAANSFVGPPLGGLLFAAAAALPLFVDAATFLVSAAVLMTVRVTTPERSLSQSLMADMAEGLRFIWSHSVIRAFAVGAGVINLSFTAANAILVLFAREELGLRGAGFGLLLAGGAVGSVAGTVVAGRVARAMGRRAAVLASVVGFSASLAVLAATSNAVVAGAALACFGLFGEVWNVIAVSYRQSAVPERLLGRVMATYRVIAYGAFPVGALLGGALGQAVGLRAGIAAGAVLTLGLAVYLRAALGPLGQVVAGGGRPDGQEAEGGEADPRPLG